MKFTLLLFDLVTIFCAKVRSWPRRKHAIVPKSVIQKDVAIDGSVVCGGTIDFHGLINGKISCDIINVGSDAQINGEVVSRQVHMISVEQWACAKIPPVRQIMPQFI